MSSPSRRDFVTTSASALAALSLLPALPADVAAHARRGDLQFRVRPFDLKDVRLLPGVFREDVEVNRRFMMGLDPDRLMHSFRITAGLPSTAEPYYGWEAPNNELRGHFVGHYLSGCALMAAQLDDPAVKARGDLMVAELARCQSPSGYLSAFPEELFDRLKAHRPVWAPFYTLHKIMAGMLDSYSLSANTQALDVVKRMTEWVRHWAAPVDDTQMARVLNVEFGGMSEVLYNLAAVTHDFSLLDLAHRFDHERILGPLAQGRDELKGVHANTTIPKIIGAARRYEITGDQTAHDTVDYFWREVTQRRSFVTGGTSSGENWPTEPGKLASQLASDTEESCVTYNMLKLTRQMFTWTADPRLADYYERALFNGMLGTQHPADGEKIYYTPLASGYWRMFGTPEHGFWCCHGSGVESHSKFGDSIYFHDDDGIFVNQFIASSVSYPYKDVRLTQETSFPREDRTRITVHTMAPTAMSLRIRVPYWVTGNASLHLNGRAMSVRLKPGSFVAIARTWNNGDRVDFTMPMSLRIEPMPDDPTLQAVMYGPLVLAGKLGHEVTRAGPTPPRMSPDFTAPPVAAPVITAPSADVASWVRSVPGKPLEFTTVGQQTNVALVPFNGLFDERYVVYWKVATG